MIVNRRTLAMLLSLRYIQGSSKERFLSLMIIVCFCAILIGACSLTLVACIMSGFEKATHEKLRGIHSQIIMRTSGGTLEFERIKEIIIKEFPSVQTLSPTNVKHALINTKSDDSNNIILLKGIDAAYESNIKTMVKKIIPINGNVNLEELLANNQFIMGKKLAEILKISIGDSINLWSTNTDQYTDDVTFNKMTVTISAFFETGIEEFDMSVLFCSTQCLHDFFEQGITQININLVPGANESQAIAALKKRFHLETYSWKELYPALVSALKLEKYAMFFILMLIAIVAGMNIVSLLFMYITQKRKDIAILKAYGTPQKTINAIFMIIGIGISASAALGGLIIAFVICLLLSVYPFISLPDTYYVSHLPVSMEWNIFALVFLVILGIGTIASFFSIKKSKTLLISSVLKGEE